MRILITGAGGFIGTELIRKLAQAEFKAISYPGDILKIGTYNESCDAIVHLASKVLPSSVSALSDYEPYRVNVLGTLAVAEYAKQKKLPLVFTSSSAVYSPAKGTLRVKEDQPIRLESANGLTKLLAEDIIRQTINDTSGSATILRLFNVYGAGQKEPYLIPYVLRCLQNNEPIELRYPQAERDFVHVSDVCDAIIQALRKKQSAGTHTYNVGTGTATKVSGVIQLLQSLLGKSGPVAASQPHSNEVLSMIADISKTTQELGWKPKYGINEGLEMLS